MIKPRFKQGDEVTINPKGKWYASCPIQPSGIYIVLGYDHTRADEDFIVVIRDLYNPYAIQYPILERILEPVMTTSKLIELLDLEPSDD